MVVTSAANVFVAASSSSPSIPFVQVVCFYVCSCTRERMCGCVCIRHISGISASEHKVNESLLPLLSPPSHRLIQISF